MLSAIEITEADIASSDAGATIPRYNTGLFAAVDRSTFLFTRRRHSARRASLSGQLGAAAQPPTALHHRTIRTQQSVISEPFVTNIGDANMVLVVTMRSLPRNGG
jgi:hypothetical protein